MKRTPDAISKKKQEIGGYIRATKLKINDLHLRTVLSEENKLAINKEIKYHEEQLIRLTREMKELYKQGVRPGPQYQLIRKLYPGVV
jgi:hypothetical protein